jgi:predicted nucleic acid-binding protein
MAALDTNVVLRLLVGDDKPQARAAERLVASQPCTVALSVLMECELVLRGVYGLNAATISSCFQSFLALENISAIDPVQTQRTLDAFGAGLDFADALHATQCPEGQSFATFDKTFARRAPKAGMHHVALLGSASR